MIQSFYLFYTNSFSVNWKSLNLYPSHISSDGRSHPFYNFFYWTLYPKLPTYPQTVRSRRWSFFIKEPTIYEHSDIRTLMTFRYEQGGKDCEDSDLTDRG